MVSEKSSYSTMNIWYGIYNTISSFFFKGTMLFFKEFCLRPDQYAFSFCLWSIYTGATEKTFGKYITQHWVVGKRSVELHVADCRFQICLFVLLAPQTHTKYAMCFPPFLMKNLFWAMIWSREHCSSTCPPVTLPSMKSCQSVISHGPLCPFSYNEDRGVRPR